MDVGIDFFKHFRIGTSKININNKIMTKENLCNFNK